LFNESLDILYQGFPGNNQRSNPQIAIH